MDRSSRPEVFCKKGVLRNFVKFTGKHMCQSLFFNKVAGARNFIKKETLVQMFLGTPFLTEHLWWLLLNERLLSLSQVKAHSLFYTTQLQELEYFDVALKRNYQFLKVPKR